MLPAEQDFELVLIEILQKGESELIGLFFGRFVRQFLEEVVQFVDVLLLFGELIERAENALQARKFLEKLVCRGRIVPEIGFRRESFELSYLRLDLRQVKDAS